MADAPPADTAAAATTAATNDDPVSSASLLLPASGDTTALRIMKWVVIVLGIALVLGFFTVIGRMVYLTSRTDASRDGAKAVTTAASSAKAAALSTLAVPAGHEVRSLSLDGNRLAVHVAPASGGAGSISVIDLATGAVESRITLTAEPPKP